MPASAEHCPLYLSQAGGHSLLSLACVFVRDSRSYNVCVFRLRHKNGCGHVFDRESGAVRESAFDHENSFAHESVCGGYAFLSHLLAADKTPLQVETVLSCSFGVGG